MSHLLTLLILYFLYIISLSPPPLTILIELEVKDCTKALQKTQLEHNNLSKKVSDKTAEANVLSIKYAALKSSCSKLRNDKEEIVSGCKGRQQKEESKIKDFIVNCSTLNSVLDRQNAIVGKTIEKNAEFAIDNANQILNFFDEQGEDSDLYAAFNMDENNRFPDVVKSLKAAILESAEKQKLLAHKPELVRALFLLRGELSVLRRGLENIEKTDGVTSELSYTKVKERLEKVEAMCKRYNPPFDEPDQAGKHLSWSRICTEWAVLKDAYKEVSKKEREEILKAAEKAVEKRESNNEEAFKKEAEQGESRKEDGDDDEMEVEEGS